MQEEITVKVNESAYHSPKYPDYSVTLRDTGGFLDSSIIWNEDGTKTFQRSGHSVDFGSVESPRHLEDHDCGRENCAGNLIDHSVCRWSVLYNNHPYMAEINKVIRYLVDYLLETEEESAEVTFTYERTTYKTVTVNRQLGN